MKDPIVEEVRQARKKIEEQAGNDLKRFYDMMKREEQKLKKDGWRVIRRKPRVTAKPK